VERTGAPTHEQGERSPVAVRKKCLADGWPEVWSTVLMLLAL